MYRTTITGSTTILACRLASQRLPDSRSRRTVGRLAIVAAFLGGSAVAIGATPAEAVCKQSKAYCKLQFAGLYLHHGNDTGKGLSAEIDRTKTKHNKLIKNFTGPSGDLLEMHTRIRDRAPQGNSVYIQWKLHANGSYCYRSTSVGVTAAKNPQATGSSVDSCASGWHGEGTKRDKNARKDGRFEGMQYLVPILLDQNSIRIAMRPCQDESFSPDTCLKVNGKESYRVGGVSY